MDCSKCATVAQRWDFRVGGCGGSTARGTGNIYVAVAGSVLLEGLKTINAGLAHLGCAGVRKQQKPLKDFRNRFLQSNKFSDLR